MAKSKKNTRFGYLYVRHTSGKHSNAENGHVIKLFTGPSLINARYKTMNFIYDVQDEIALDEINRPRLRKNKTDFRVYLSEGEKALVQVFGIHILSGKNQQEDKNSLLTFLKSLEKEVRLYWQFGFYEGGCPYKMDFYLPGVGDFSFWLLRDAWHFGLDLLKKYNRLYPKEKITADKSDPVLKYILTS